MKTREEEEESMRWMVFGEDNHVKMAKCDLWWDPENIHKRAISLRERWSSLISPDKMLHIKEELNEEPAGFHIFPHMF